ncbi:MAG: histidine phosphatase family protein [Rhodocyclaceae bacterium]|nr:histidine phosphatase family protein [Rhodocyclaceae bacterium]
MDLLLWRHAEAEELKGEGKDLERALTEKGLRQARKMAQWLKPRLPKTCRILVSPAKRAQETALALGLPYEREPRIAPGADCAALLAVSGWPTNDAPVLLVGHQPALGRLAALLLAGEEDDWTIKKGAVWWFSRRSREGREKTFLRLAIDPSLLD